MLFLGRIFVALSVLCLSYGAVADDADDADGVLLAAVAKENSNSEVVFEDVESLADLIQQLDWQNSNQQERRDLYQKLTNLLGEIDSIRKVSLQELEKQKIDDTQEAYDQARENEQSVENKLLGGVSMAAMGVAGMELASAVSEKNVMENAGTQFNAFASKLSTADTAKQVMSIWAGICPSNAFPCAETLTTFVDAFDNLCGVM